MVDASAARAISIDFVTVGNAGNATTPYPSPVHGRGAVAYEYRIGKYEITAGQYTAFLNAIAADDTHNLYTASMGQTAGSIVGCNIQRFGSPGSYTYSVATDWADRPVNFVNIWDAARFANWMHNGQPIGAQGPATSESGAYHDLGDPALFGRSPGARFFFPNEDEWFKAAYHDKSAGLAASYFLYPTRSNTAPGNDPTESTNPGNNGNWRVDGQYAIGPPYYRTAVGDFELSASPYGTFDQGGNIAEWVEPGSTSTWGAAVWGAQYGTVLGQLDTNQGEPLFRSVGDEFQWLGFRLAASIPPPGDFNSDGRVDAADYVVWRKGLGTTYSQTDYAVWRTHFGQTAGSGSGSVPLSAASNSEPVPEPTSLAPFAGVLAGLIVRRRPSRRIRISSRHGRWRR